MVYFALALLTSTRQQRERLGSLAETGPHRPDVTRPCAAAE